MKTGIICTIERILSGIRINRLPDKAAKSVLLKDYLAVRKVAKDAEAEKREIVTKFQSDWKEEMDDPSRRGDAFAQAEQDAEKALSEVEGREVEISLGKVNAEALYEPDLWAEDILLAQIPGSIDFLIENGVAE